jgi:protein SCO1
MNRTVKTLCLLLSFFSTAIHGADVADDAGLIAGVFTPPRQAPEFSLQGSNGAELKLDTYRGKVLVVGFGFTSCPEICPTTLAVLAEARRRLGADAEDLQVVYITVDPQTDSPERMRKYLATFDPTFIGGTGSEEQLAQVRKEYGIIASKKDYGSNYTFAHSSYTYLIDRDGKLRALMTYGHTPADYVHDVRILLQE